MSSASISQIPSWLVNPTLLHNVFKNQFTSLKDISSITNLSDSTFFSAGLHQALFWKKRLSPSTSKHTVIFLLGPKGLLTPNVSEVCQALSSICNISSISEIYRAFNSHFIGISFTNSSDASMFRSSFSYFADAIVIHVSTSSPFVHHFKLLWLPPLFPDTRIHHFLNKHSIKHSFSRDIVSTGSNSHSPTNSITGILELSPHTDIKLLPHLIPLPSPHLGNALFIISDRPSLCLRCGQVGHVRRSCPAPRCISCHRFHLHSTPCSSYDPAIDFTSLDPLSFNNIDYILDSAPEHHLTSSNAPSLLSTTTSTLPDNPINHASPCLPTPLPVVLSSINTSSQLDTRSESIIHISNKFQHLQDEASDLSTAQCPAPISPMSIIPVDTSPTISPHTATCFNTSVSENFQIQPPSPNDYIMSDVSVNLDSGSSTPSSLSPSKKKYRPSSSSPKHLSSTPPELSASSPHLDWSRQVDDTFPLSPACPIDPPAAVSSQTSHDPHHSLLSTFELLQPHPTDTVSRCSIRCHICNAKNVIALPIDDIYVCIKCDVDITINLEEYFIPYPSDKTVFIIISKSFISDPNNISYLKFWLANKVRLKSIST